MQLSLKPLISIALLAATITPAFAAPAGFAEGVRAYGARRYAEAAGYFRQAAAQDPRNALVHYYLGLSYQGTNQMSLAKAEYNYAASAASDPSLRSQASAALNNLSRYSTTYSGTSMPSSSASPKIASASAPSGGPKINGRLQILYFTADW